jgi:heme exporter protein A
MSLYVDSLHFSYKCSDLYWDKQSKLLNNISFKARSGTALKVIGNNGVGKSTLLKIIAGIYAPDCGSVTIDNSKQKLTIEEYFGNICYLGHKLGLDENLTVTENIQLDVNNKLQPSQTNELLAMFELLNVQHKSCKIISAGQKKRLALSRILSSKAYLWVLDEPFSALDQSFIPVLVQLIIQHLENYGILIYTSHQEVDFGGYPHYKLHLCNK